MGSTPPSFWADILRVAIPAALVVVGWLVVSRQHDSRELRKEIRGIISLLSDRVDKCKASALLYYAEDDDDKADSLAGSIKSDLSFVTSYLAVVRLAGLKINASRQFNRFKRAITGGYFETARRHDQLAIPHWREELEQSAADLVLYLEGRYFKDFK